MAQVLKKDRPSQAEIKNQEQSSALQCPFCDNPLSPLTPLSTNDIPVATCPQCNANVVVVDDAQSQDDGRSSVSWTKRVNSPPTATWTPIRRKGIVLSAALCLVNYVFLFFIGAWGIEQANERYDPYEVDEHFYTGFMLEKQGWTPLHMAAAQGDEERVRQLLSDPTQQLEARNHWGRTPLYEAAKRGQLGTMTLLIDRGANLEAKGNHGFTPMFPAIQRGHLKAVELLVSRGAQVDARCECGATALYEAVKWGQEDVAQFLAEHGASVNARINGQTALAYAEEHEMEDMAKILRHFGGKTFKESEELVKKGVEFFKKNQWDQALALFTQAIEKDPESISAYSNRAATQIKKGELDLALGDYRRILQLAPNHIDTYMKISWIHGQRKQWDLGIELWSTLIKIEPKNGLAYYERGRHEFYKPDHEAARQDLRSSCSFGYTEGCDMLKSMGG